MPVSIRLDKETGEQLNQVAKRLKVNKLKYMPETILRYLVAVKVIYPLTTEKSSSNE